MTKRLIQFNDLPGLDYLSLKGLGIVKLCTPYKKP